MENQFHKELLFNNLEENKTEPNEGSNNEQHRMNENRSPAIDKYSKNSKLVAELVKNLRWNQEEKKRRKIYNDILEHFLEVFFLQAGIHISDEERNNRK